MPVRLRRTPGEGARYPRTAPAGDYGVSHSVPAIGFPQAPTCLRYRATASGANTAVIPIAHATAPHT